MTRHKSIPGRTPGKRFTPPQSTAPTRKNRFLFAALSLSVVIAAGYLLWPAFRLGSLFGSAQAVEIAVSMSGFYPERIKARVGQPLTIRMINKDNQFHSDGGGWHQFAIDELGIDFRVPPLATKDFAFIPDKPGTYGFYCDVCCGGKDNPYMHGQLIVEG